MATTRASCLIISMTSAAPVYARTVSIFVNDRQALYTKYVVWLTMYFHAVKTPFSPPYVTRLMYFWRHFLKQLFPHRKYYWFRIIYTDKMKTRFLICFWKLVKILPRHNCILISHFCSTVPADVVFLKSFIPHCKINITFLLSTKPQMRL